MKVAILMGSISDKNVMSKAQETLNEFKIENTMRVMSAHRTPQLVINFIQEFEKNGGQIIIAGAGCAAHLAGVIAAHTTLPVIGVPLNASLNGLDSLLSTVQMPPGIPVATVGIGGSKNAALLSVAILALQDPQLANQLQEYRLEMRKKVESIQI